MDEAGVPVWVGPYSAREKKKWKKYYNWPQFSVTLGLWRTFIHLVWSTISEPWYSHCTIDGKNGKEIQVKAQWSNHIKCCIKSSPSIFLVSFQTSLQRGSKFKHFLESNIYQWMSLKKRKKIKNKPKKQKQKQIIKKKDSADLLCSLNMWISVHSLYYHNEHIASWIQHRLKVQP